MLAPQKGRDHKINHMKGWLGESYIPLHLIHCLSSCALSHWLLNSYGKNALIYSTGVCGKTHLDLKPKVLKSFVKQGSIQSAKIGGARLLWWNAPGSFVQSVEKANSFSDLQNIACWTWKAFLFLVENARRIHRPILTANQTEHEPPVPEKLSWTQ